MYKLLFITLLIALPFQGKTQAFTFLEGNLIEKNISVDDFDGSETKIVNESDVAVVFVWELITAEHPEGWETNVCDYEVCYFLGETTGTMSSVDAGSTTAFLRMNVTATSEGTGIFEFIVYDQYFPLDSDTIKMVFTAIDDVNVDQYGSSNDLSATLINPTTVKVINNNDLAVSYEIYSMTGLLMGEGQILRQEILLINIDHYPNGLYFIRFRNEMNSIQFKKLIKSYY